MWYKMCGVGTEAGMFAIRARRKSISEKDLIEAINKVVKGYAKFSATPKYYFSSDRNKWGNVSIHRYMVYN